jgi:hypothetical protein
VVPHLAQRIVCVLLGAQLVEQRPGFFEVASVEALGEPAVDVRLVERSLEYQSPRRLVGRVGSRRVSGFQGLEQLSGTPNGHHLETSIIGDAIGPIGDANRPVSYGYCTARTRRLRSRSSHPSGDSPRERAGGQGGIRTLEADCLPKDARLAIRPKRFGTQDLMRPEAKETLASQGIRDVSRFPTGPPNSAYRGTFNLDWI